MWLLTEGFVERVGEWWNNYSVIGKPSFVLAKKLKMLKEDLRKWNIEIFGRLEFQKGKVVDVISHWDLEEQVRDLSEEEKLLRDNAKEEFGEDLLVKEEEISVGIANFYESLFREEVIWRPRVDDPTQVGYLRCVLLCFEAASGLKVNLGKSEMIPVGAVDDINGLAQLLGCKVARLPALYLGLPLGSSFKSTAVWDSVVVRFQKLIGRVEALLYFIRR
ncbi:hypothetical protein Vadar_015625 [Vaccinium darrowii]|uniref:Uncharacterized protein n=1 Tax=Vaccinium darrowii TaxID=229202 RepID=A0ACB7X1N5_9ERIC|nr:hypothetical protein Vadar_015625 [Vaccinium darrowii]